VWALPAAAAASWPANSYSAPGIPIHAVPGYCSAAFEGPTHLRMTLQVFDYYGNEVASGDWAPEEPYWVDGSLDFNVTVTGPFSCEVHVYQWAAWTWVEVFGDTASFAFYIPIIDITINTFIPEQWVDDPIGASFDSSVFLPWTWRGPGVYIFQGDDRAWNRSGSSRSHIQVSVASPRADIGSYVMDTVKGNYPSAKYHKPSSLDGGYLTWEAWDDWSPDDDDLKVGWAQAPASEIGDCSTALVDVDRIDVVCAANSHNPLVYWGGAGITYYIIVSLQYDEYTGQVVAWMDLQHDGFPNYEVYAGDQPIHTYSHGAYDPSSLFPPTDEWTYGYEVIQ